MGNNDNHHLATNLAEFCGGGGGEDFLRYSSLLLASRHMKPKRQSMRCFDVSMTSFRGRSGGAMVLGKLSVPGSPTNLDDSRARAYCRHRTRK